MFEIIEDYSEPLDAIAIPRLQRLVKYWADKCAGRKMPSRDDIDPLEMVEHMGRLHLLDVLGPRHFRYRLYGSAITNPGVRDMTSHTTLDYANKNFGEMVTRHYQACVDQKSPIFHYVLAKLRRERYEYYRLTLPLSNDGETVNMLLVSPHRLHIPVPLPRQGSKPE